MTKKLGTGESVVEFDGLRVGRNSDSGVSDSYLFATLVSLVSVKDGPELLREMREMVGAGEKK